MPLSIGSYVSLADGKGGLRYGRIIDLDNPEPGFAVMEEKGSGVCYAEPADSPLWRVVTRQAVHVGAKLHPAMGDFPDEAVEAMAKALMRHHGLGYTLGQRPTWREWADEARELLTIAERFLREGAQ